VIRLDDETYWLYAAVDPETNELLHTKLKSTTTKVFAHSFLTELSEKHDVSDAVFLVDGSHSLQDVCHRHGFDFRYEKHGNRNAVEHIFREIKCRTTCFQTVSATPTQKPLTTGSDHSASDVISLPEHYHWSGGVRIRIKDEAVRLLSAYARDRTPQRR
jgi:transposase-like protein